MIKLILNVALEITVIYAVISLTFNFIGGDKLREFATENLMEILVSYVINIFLVSIFRIE